MKTKLNAAGQPVGAGPSYAQKMIKRAVMWAYNHGLISGRAVINAFERFELWGA